MINAVCQHCNDDFSYAVSGIERKFCSRPCYLAHPRTKHYDWAGSGTTNKKVLPVGNDPERLWKAVDKLCVCRTCAKEFTIRTSRKGLGATCCSKECAHLAAQLRLSYIFNR